MKEAKKKVISEWKTDVKNALERNIEYLRSVQCKPPKNTNIEIKNIPSIKVIPPTYSIPRYKYYIEVKKSMGVENREVLNYVPYVNQTKIENITNYKTTELTKPPYSAAIAVRNRLIIEILNKNTVEFNNSLRKDLKKNYSLRKSLPEEYKKLSDFLQLDILKILNIWEEIYVDRKQCRITEVFGSNSLYFCPICCVFDCDVNLHSQTDKRILKMGEEFVLCNSSEYCYKNRRRRQTYGKSLVSPKKETEKFLKDSVYRYYMIKEYIDTVYSFFRAEPCFTKKLLKLKFNLSFPCFLIYEIIKEVLGDKPSFSNRKTEMKESNSIKKLDLKCVAPCDHVGPCKDNEDCSCYTIDRYCTDTCLCKNCDLVMKTCKCSKCSDNCPCFKKGVTCNGCKCECCYNKPIIDRKKKKVYPYISKIAGYGLFAGEDIKKDEFIVEYVGELVSSEEGDRRGKFYDIVGHSYLFDVCTIAGCDKTLDALYIGNDSKFMNDSKDPNVYFRILLDKKTPRICFFAKQDIKKHEELFFSYGYKKDFQYKTKTFDSRFIY